MRTIRAVIADDEKFMREALRDQLATLWPDLEIVAESEDGPQALRDITEHKPDIAFLDIRMPGLTGLQVAQLVPNTTKIVFVTAYDSHALEAFEANAVDYVLKPIDPVRMAKVVTKLRTASAPTSNAGHVAAMGQLKAGETKPTLIHWLHVSLGQKVVMLHIDDVYFFESDTKYTRVVGKDCDGLIRTSIKELKPQLPESFVQIHRSSVVNRHYVKAVHRIDDNVELEIRDYPAQLKVSETNRYLFKAM